ncbi:hypothetical protein LSCM1_07884 [Leishmania martiniquensis]|uniref:Rnh202 triple barrel domain-containing protein n=1 Tax=Leishmania martiniquensis TaxID=1580590 RepID=A0A836HUJ1_9TRYP|nr:hypothetical protein LSCM1_07884 [Leishmania martiniquensis]
MSQPSRSDDVCHASTQEAATGAAVGLRCEAPVSVFTGHALESATCRHGVVCSSDVGTNDDVARGDGDADALGSSDNDNAEDSGYASASSPPSYSCNSASSTDGLRQLSSPSSRCPPVRYDPQDRTTPFSVQARSSSSPGKVQRRRLWILPHEVLPPECLASLRPARSSLGASEKSCGDADAYASEGRDSACALACTAIQSIAAAAEAPAAAGGAHPLIRTVSHPNVSAVSTASLSSQRMLNASVIRLPHPRHGQPFLCLAVHHPVPSIEVRAPTATSPSSSPVYSSLLLYEVQAQAPPSGFAQSWFVKEQVVPSTVGDGELLVATPLDLTFFALYELLGDAQRYERLSRAFMSAEELYRDRGLLLSALDSASATGCRAAASEAIASASVFSGTGGGGEESQSSSASTSAPFTAEVLPRCGVKDTPVSVGVPQSWARDQSSHPTASSFSSSAPPERRSGYHRCAWAGWAHAAAAHPLLLQHCLNVLQSDSVLRRLCEVREIGGDHSAEKAPSDAPGDSHRTVYYKPSESVAVEWLKRKVQRVRASTVLREILQLPAGSPVATATAASAARPEAFVEVPMSIAFGVVAEYVPERLQTALAVACGLPDPSEALVSSPTAAAPFDDAQRSGDGGALSMRRKAGGAVGAAGPKSASVRRLEKAGRPTGTPTLLDMFAKKKPKAESSVAQVWRPTGS